MARVPIIVAALLGILAIPSVPWLILAFPPVAAELTGVPYGWNVWLMHVIDAAGFSIAAFLAYRRARYWLPVAILICGYITVVATPPFVRMSIDGGFFTLIGIIWNQALRTGGSWAFYLIWNLIVLPILPALLIPFAAWGWWKTREVAR